VPLLDGANTWSANQSVSKTGSVAMTVQTTTSGGANDAEILVKRGDTTNGYANFSWWTGGGREWSAGTRAGGTNFGFTDETNAVTLLTLAQGAIGAATVTFGGTLDATSSTAAAVKTAGGFAAAKAIWSGTFVATGVVALGSLPACGAGPKARACS
jgi:hypothetical protein